MPLQAVALRRCASCDRWHGTRSVDQDPAKVSIAAATDSGLCVGGPWDGNERRACSACGRWLRWRALPPESSGSG